MIWNIVIIKFIRVWWPFWFHLIFRNFYTICSQITAILMPWGNENFKQHNWKKTKSYLYFLRPGCSYAYTTYADTIFMVHGKPGNDLLWIFFNLPIKINMPSKQSAIGRLPKQIPKLYERVPMWGMRFNFLIQITNQVVQKIEKKQYFYNPLLTN